jgi:cytosine/adenosine deaminase-related metal-dependent hydrolase
MTDILIHDGIVITMDPHRRVLENTSIAIADGRILEVGAASELEPRHRSAKRIDARRKVVLPGMVDLHAHMGGGLVKTIGEGLDATRWRNMFEFIVSHATDHEWWRVETRINALERLKFGVTCIYTQLGGNGTRTDETSLTKLVADELEAIGLRARIGLAPARPPWPRPYSYWSNGKRTQKLVSFEEVMEVCDAILTRHRNQPSNLVDYCVALSRLGNQNPHDPMWSPDRETWVRRQAEAMRDLMKRHHVGFWTHMYGNAIEYAHDQRLELLGPNTIISHCTDISQRSIDILRETGTSVAHHPRAARIYTFPGRCPVPELIEAGVAVGLGADGPPPNRNCDIFLDMKAAMRLQRVHFKDPDVMPAGKLLEMATIDAYKALRLDHELGSIEVGKKADIITVDLYQPHLYPINMPVHRVVYEATGQDVRDVIVDGRLVMEGRKLLTIDEGQVLDESAEMNRKMIERAGLAPFAAIPERFWGVAR